MNFWEVQARSCSCRHLRLECDTSNSFGANQVNVTIADNILPAMPSRWADTEEDAAEDARRKAEKEEKKRLKAEKARQAEEAQRLAAAQREAQQEQEDRDDRPTKRRRLSNADPEIDPPAERKLLRWEVPSWSPSRPASLFDRLNAIEEGSYGYVSRARSKEPGGEVVALKKLKLDPIPNGGFPVTALREIQCLNASKGHRHIVELKEVVVDGKGHNGLEGVYLVMEFLEHDLKTLLEDMPEPFMMSEVKTLLLQLGSAIEYLHDHWILHRDLKTSNILMNNRGEIKLADFGMARFVGDPPPRNLTQLVVTLWYRSPELLLGTKEYDGAVDMWSIGCIFGELLLKDPLLSGKNEVDQLSKVSPFSSPQRGWKDTGTPIIPNRIDDPYRSLSFAVSRARSHGLASSASLMPRRCVSHRLQRLKPVPSSAASSQP